MSKLKLVLVISLCLVFGVSAGGWALTNVAIAAGDLHTVVIKNNSTLWAWGGNGYGQVGIGTVTTSVSYQTQITGLTGVAAIGAGSGHTLAARSDGTLWTWGYNGFGQLGLPPNSGEHSAPTVISGQLNVASVTGGYYHSLALKNDGTVWAWGKGSEGQLGNGTTWPYAAYPVNVSGLAGAVAAIASGGYHNVVLKSDGTVWAWGRNAYGQLGNGATTQATTPVRVSGLTNVVAIAAGDNHTVALKGDGTVWTWGSNSFGELGNGSNTNSSIPVQISGLSGVVKVAAGGYNGMALKNDGTVWTWGGNVYGQLGNGTTTDSNTPVQVSGLTNALAIEGGSGFAVALTSDGRAWSWGNNACGSLGYATPWFVNPVPKCVPEPPDNPVVADEGAYTHSSNSLSAGWSATDSESGIAEYQYAIGTSPNNPNGANLVGWKSAGIGLNALENGLSIGPGVTYYWYVRARNGLGMWSDVGVSDGITLDGTPPSRPVVVDEGVYTQSFNSMSATWASVDSETGVAGYQYAIGTSPTDPNGTNLVGWTSVGTATGITSSLSLASGVTYYWYVKAKNGSGVWSDVGISDGVVADLTPPSKPVVTDEGVHAGSLTSLPASWSSVDSESGVAEYQYAIGTSPTNANGTNLVAWKSAGIATQASESALLLKNGITYYWYVRARNVSGVWSDYGISDGVTALDCNGNGVPDQIEIQNGTVADCNHNGIPDSCEAAKAANVDIVFVVDTSGSMTDELTTLCSTIDSACQKLSQVGVDVRATVLGITEQLPGQPCITGTVIGLPNRTVPVTFFEDWGPGTAAVAKDFVWREGATRIVVPCSDEGPANGDPVDASDNAAIDNATALARDNGVVAIPMIGNGDPNTMTQIWDLANRLADGTKPYGFAGSLTAVQFATDPTAFVRAVFDVVKKAAGTTDVDRNGIPDECDIAAGILADCNGNGVPDVYETTLGLMADTNGNSIPDVCEDQDTNITSGPTQGSTVSVANATFAYAGYPAEPPGVATYSVSLDDGPWSAYDVATSHTIVGLADGLHRFCVKSRSGAGKEDATPTCVDFAVNTVPPAAPVVDDGGDITHSLDTLQACWIVSDAGSGIVARQYAIGTSPVDPGSGCVVAWKGSSGDSATETGLQLVPGTTYYWYVKAQNGVGLWSPVGISDGIRVEEFQPQVVETPGAAKMLADGTKVRLTGVRVSATAQQMGGRFYVEEPGRSSGIAVELASTVELGRTVDVEGIMSTIGTERCITSPTIEVLPAEPIIVKPIGMILRTAICGDWRYDSATGAGQKGMPGGTGGVSTVGLLVKIFGSIVEVGDGYILVNDGSVSNDYSVSIAVNEMEDGPFPIGSIVSAAGVLSVRESAALSVRSTIQSQASASMKLLPVGPDAIRVEQMAPFDEKIEIWGMDELYDYRLSELLSQLPPSLVLPIPALANQGVKLTEALLEGCMNLDLWNLRATISGDSPLDLRWDNWANVRGKVPKIYYNDAVQNLVPTISLCAPSPWMEKFVKGSGSANVTTRHMGTGPYPRKWRCAKIRLWRDITIESDRETDVEMPLDVSGGVLTAESFGDEGALDARKTRARAWIKLQAGVDGKRFSNAVDIWSSLGSAGGPDQGSASINARVPLHITPGKKTISVWVVGAAYAESGAKGAGYMGLLAGASTAVLDLPEMNIGNFTGPNGGPLPPGLWIHAADPSEELTYAYTK